MKKLVLFSVLVLLVIGVMAQGNRFYYGDKSEKKIKQAIVQFEKQISEYKVEIAGIEKKSDRLIGQFRRSSDGVIIGVISKRIAANDSLVAVYRGKLDQAEFAKEEALARLAGKDKLAFVSSWGNNPEELLAASTAYANMTYADAYVNKMGEKEVSASVNGQMTGSVTNLYFRDVQVVITGPAGFHLETYLPKKTGNLVFEVPVPGLYTATFLYHETGMGMAKAVVTKEASLNPNQVVYDPRGGKHTLCFTMLKGY